MVDYIPRSDADFDLWQTSFDKYLKDHLAAFGLVAGDLASLNALETAWAAAFTDYQSKKALLDAALALKDTTRVQLEAALRALTRQLQTNPDTTDEHRAGLGISIPDTTPTRVPTPTTNPIGQLDTSIPLQHTLHFRDSQTPDSKAKPQGYRGCQIWVYTGTQAPLDLAQFDYVATDTRTPYIIHFDMADVGKTAHYRLRWVNTRDEPGPWSEPISATITG